MNHALSIRFLTALTTKQEGKIEYQRQTGTQEKFQREKYYFNMSFLVLLKQPCKVTLQLQKRLALVKR